MLHLTSKLILAAIAAASVMACGGGDTTAVSTTTTVSASNTDCTGDVKSVLEASALTAGITLKATGTTAGYFTDGKTYTLKSDGGGTCTLNLTTDTATSQKRSYKANALDKVGGSATLETSDLYPDSKDSTQKGQLNITKTLATGKYSAAIFGLSGITTLAQP